MFSFKNKQQKQQQPPTSPGDNTYTRQLHPTKYGRVQTIDSTKPFDEKVSDNLLLTSNEDGSLVESELSTTDQHLVAPTTPAADIVDELDVLGDTNDKLNKEDLLKLANKDEEETNLKKEDLLDNISIFSVKDDSFSVTDGDESTDESAKSGSARSDSTNSSKSGKSKGSSVKSRLSIRSNKSKSSTLQSVHEGNVMSDKQANDAYNKLWHTSNSSQKSAAGEGGGSTAASQTSEKSQKKKGSAADAQSLDNTFEEDGQSVYSSSYISVYSAAATERSVDSFMSKKSVKSSKSDDVNADKNIDTDAVVEESPKDEEEKKEEVPAARVVVDTHSALEKDEETPSEESEGETKKKATSLPLFNKKKNLKSKRFFGKNKNKKNASSEDVEDSIPLPVHVNEMSDEEVEITYGSSLPSKEEKKSTKEDCMARTTSNTTAPTVESKEEEDEEELEKVVPFTVSHSYYGAGAEDDDDGGFFGKLLSCTGVPQCNGGVDGEFDNVLVDSSNTKEEGQTNRGEEDEEEEAYLNVEIFEDGNATRIGYFMESTDEDDDQANDKSDDRSINMRVRSKDILKTKVPSGSEDDVVDNIANKLQEQEQQKDNTAGNTSLDNSLKSKKKNVLRMKLLKRLSKKETVTN